MIYDSFDILPILNWHNVNKTNDLFWLFDSEKEYQKHKSKAKEIYEKLIDSKGKFELINGYYARCFQLLLQFKHDKNPKTEQKYNDAFDLYLKKIENQIDVFEYDDVKYNNIKDAYFQYFKLHGYIHCLENRLYDFNFFDLKFKPYDYDIFSDIAAVETILNISIDPTKISVSHFEALKKNAKSKTETKKK